MLAVVCFIRKKNASSATVACVTSTSVMLSKMSAGFPCRGMSRMYIIIPRSTSTASAVSSSDSSRSELTGARGEKVNSSVSGWRVRRSRRKYITANCAKGRRLQLLEDPVARQNPQKRSMDVQRVDRVVLRVTPRLYVRENRKHDGMRGRVELGAKVA